MNRYNTRLIIQNPIPDHCMHNPVDAAYIGARSLYQKILGDREVFFAQSVVNHIHNSVFQGVKGIYSFPFTAIVIPLCNQRRNI